MKIFIDTGNLKDVEGLVPLGIIDGITTNPSLLSKESGDPRDILKRICQLVQGPTSAEVVSTAADAMVREGRDLASIDKHIVVKVPFTRDGVKACKTLSSEGIKVNVTLCFSPTQALIAAKVGASYISPFVGRLDDISTSGMYLVREIVEPRGPGPVAGEEEGDRPEQASVRPDVVSMENVIELTNQPVYRRRSKVCPRRQSRSPNFCAA